MKVLVLAGLLMSSAAFAQREVPATDFVQPTPKDIVIGGNELARDVHCEGNAVYIQGQHNEVQVHGKCQFVRVQGNQNYVWVERVTTVPVEGNENNVFVSDPLTTYSSRGTGNRFEKAKH